MASWLVRSTQDQVVWVHLILSSRPGQGHCALCLGNILYFHNPFLNPGDGLASHPGMSLVTLCYSRALHATGGQLPRHLFVLLI